MQFTIQIFAGLRDLLQADSITLEANQESLSSDHLKQLIIKKYPHSEAVVSVSFIAKNQAYAAPDAIIKADDEIALIPPVSGGQQSNAYTSHNGAFRLTYESLTSEEVLSYVIHPNHGASIVFVGTTREFTQGQKTVLLEYEAYPPMALKTMNQISEEINIRWPGVLCAIHHRLGKVDIAETSVIIAVSAPHRESCYEASRYAIERLKQIVPIWKKELWEDGSEWKGHQLGPWNPTQSIT
jgi:molybdopterin synthase catalytic subunit/molybdopterin converting factor small subunit